MALWITQIGVRSEICENLGGRWSYCAATLKIEANTVSFFIYRYNTFSNTYLSYYHAEQGVEKIYILFYLLGFTNNDTVCLIQEFCM